MDRDGIAAVLRRLNDAENARATTSPEEASAGIDSVMAADVEGWRNGVHVPDRTAEREVEQLLFAAVPDYRRTLDRMLVEPPLASVDWTIRGTLGDRVIEATGSSTFEVDDDGRIRRYWLHFDPSAFAG